MLHVLLKEIYGLVKYTIPRFMLFLFNRDKCIFLIRFLLYLSCVCHQNFPLGKHCENFLLDSPLRILSEKENRGTFNGSMDNGIYLRAKSHIKTRTKEFMDGLSLGVLFLAEPTLLMTIQLLFFCETTCTL